MSAESDFLSVEDVIQIHGEQIAAYGGAVGVRDQTLLESAVAIHRLLLVKRTCTKTWRTWPPPTPFTSPRISRF